MAQVRSINQFPDDGTLLNFVEEHLLPNEPCVFGESFTKQWRARQQWRKVDKDIPDLDYLEKEFGDAVVPVADCACVEFSAHSKTEMTFREYLQYWRSKVASKESNITQLLYLKDWHFVKHFPDYEAYTLLDFFKSDWLNEVWSCRTDVADDYRFVYMGPKGTWTPFHADVFRSYSWSANICGCKEWLFYPPGEEAHLCDKFGHLPFDVTSPELMNREMYPNVDKASRPITVLQRSGEIIFVPSGWHHQVRNIEDTISINHNWTNSFGVGFMWSHLKSELRLVQQELDDCKSMEGWDEQCQVILKASSGMNYWEFVQFLCLIARSRLNELKQVITHKSCLLNAFGSLETLMQTLLSNQSRPVTFMDTSVKFEGLRTVDELELVFTKNMTGSIPLKNHLPKYLQDMVSVELSAYPPGRCALITFRLYELCVVDRLLPSVLDG